VWTEERRRKLWELGWITKSIKTHLLQLTGVSGEEISIKPEFRAVSALADLSLWCHSVCTNDLLVFRVPH
jgi:hypothetical protein